MNIGKRSVLALMPATRSELLEHCPTQRHVRKLDAAIETLKKKGRVEEIRHTIVDDKQMVQTTINYALAIQAEAA